MPPKEKKGGSKKKKTGRLSKLQTGSHDIQKCHCLVSVIMSNWTYVFRISSDQLCYSITTRKPVDEKQHSALVVIYFVGRKCVSCVYCFKTVDYVIRKISTIQSLGKRVGYCYPFISNSCIFGDLVITGMKFCSKRKQIKQYWKQNKNIRLSIDDWWFVC